MRVESHVTCAVAVLAAVFALSAGRLEGQAPSPSPAPAGEAGKAGEEKEPSEEEMKEPEPATPAEKLKKDEIEKKACPTVDVKFSADTDKTTHPTPEPEPGKGLVYILRPTMMGNKIQTKLAVDGTWVGVNRGHNYFFLHLDPGDHFFCSKAENKSVLALKVEAGKTYFVEQKIKEGWMKARNKLALLSEEEGKKKLAKSHPSSWQEKK